MGKKQAEADIRGILGSVQDPILVAELVDRLRRFTFQDFERIPELRHLMTLMLQATAERQRIAESLNVIPHADLRSAFAEFMQEEFDSRMQVFFDRLYTGIQKVWKHSVGLQLEELQAEIHALRSSFLMSALHPFAWLDMMAVSETAQFLTTQPNNMATVHAIFQQLAYQVKMPIPGQSVANKMQYLTELFGRTECFKEHSGFMIELVMFDVLEEGYLNVSHMGNQGEVLSRALRQMGKAPSPPQSG